MSTGITVKTSGTGTSPIVVANYSALPAPATVLGQFYWCSASQGTYWLPGSLGGTYYSAGMYYSNGVTWEFTPIPYNADQATVDAGVNDDQFVTPKTYIQGLVNWLTSVRLLSILSITSSDLSAISGMINIHDHNPSSTATGTSEVILKSIQVGNSIFTSSDFLNVMCDFVRPIKTGTCQLRMYIGPNDNSLVGATQIALSTLNNSSVGYVTEFKREFQIKSGNLSGMKFDVAGNTPVVTISISSLAFDNTASRYLMIASTFSVGTDTGNINKVQIKNF